ncbi:MAG TPA: signal peptidase I [Candidatus Deferrimicrobiaceae bacterium]
MTGSGRKRRSGPGDSVPDVRNGAIESQGKGRGDRARKGKAREYAEAFVVALLIALLVRTFVIQAFKIPSGSMETTLLVGDHIFVNKFLYGYHIPYTRGRVLQFSKPERRDIIVFVFPEDPKKDFIKRVIALPGDTVEIREKQLILNGMPQHEPYTRFADGKTIDGFVRTRDNLPPMTVPRGKYFVMGDNRDRSYDSRFWGFVDEDAILGKALFIYFSIDWGKGIQWYQVWRYPELVRWNRIGDVLR